jgi:hypothetical protein
VGNGNIIVSPGWIPLEFPGPCEETEYRHYVLFRPLVLTDCSNEEDCPGIEPVEVGGFWEKFQPYPPSAEALPLKIQEELETANYPLYNRFANYLADPHNFPDPRVTKLTIKDKDRRCDRGTPAFENPDQNISPEPFTKKIETPFTITKRPEGFGGTNIYLHWGTTQWEPGKEGFEEEASLDLWSGWGYRHIVAKHGWNATDLEETQLALVDDLTPVNTKGSNWRYETPEISTGKEGVGCNRVVIVDYVAGEGDPRPRGIVTSFNEVK